MRCPKCGLYNPEGGIRCDCGYNFRTGLKEPKPAGPPKGHVAYTGTHTTTCPACHQAFSSAVQFCPRDGTRLAAEGLEKRDFPQRAEKMATYLVLEGAKILEAHGFGGGVPKSGLHTVKFEDKGVLAVYSHGLFGGLKKIYWAGFGRVKFYVGTVAVQSGGGWVGGGFGVRGAVKGAVTASLLNALTTKNREYAVLTVIDTDLATGAQKELSLGFQNIDEAALRNELAQAIPAWTEPVVMQWADYYKQCRDKDKAIKAVDFLNAYLERGMLSQEQADRIFVLLKEISPEAFPKPISQATSVPLAAEVRDERECPYCAELILKKARVCKHCGRDVGPLTE
jgi:hypothetical protein